ncbi:acyl-CoA synthetase short-chain family member 3, mitochondrial isoform X2 [Phymastichus coffea]|uniref:acyl-CoA synthetase short-chain family member 3, mitochondrial isoform X2 n=1 Tax=Phymastichus coffea TaxID=108790 RepID=UPI00273C51DF|nr:acyl-CoA synthetase short-chain family member 3, mitochondrial isoform X2 [Phymastichus coffea]
MLNQVNAEANVAPSYRKTEGAGYILDRGRHRHPQYDEIYRRSIDQPEEFWAEIGKCIDWSRPWDRVLDDSSRPFTKWYVGGETNACHNALDRHVAAGLGSKVALVHDSPMTNTIRRVTYAELLDTTSRLAGALSDLGVRKGDRVLIYMPLIPETICAILASARLGAVHSVVFGGFAARELATRIDHAEPRAIVTASCGLEPNKVVRYTEMLSEALQLTAARLPPCVVYQRRRVWEAPLAAGQYDWDELLARAKPHACVPVEANQPLYILYTSGTTDAPKGVQRPIGGHIVALCWSMRSIYGMDRDSVWWAASDLGWVVGTSYICYGPLLAGATSVVYEGKPDRTPDAGSYFRLRAIFCAGEHCDYEAKAWAEKSFKVPILNHWWQTETGHAVTCTCLGYDHPLDPPKYSTGLPIPGYIVEVLKEDGSKAGANELGRIALRLPLPPGVLSTLYKADDRFKQIYFSKYPGYYDTMDAGYIDEHGYVYVTARDDDVINVAGHRLSTSALEDVVLGHPDVVDAAVVGVPEPTKGEIPLCLYVAADSSEKTEEEMSKELISRVRELVGPIAAFKLAGAVRALPRTRSGKTCRKSIADLARSKRVKIVSTIEDASVYKYVKEALQKLGYAQNAPDPE